MSIKLIELIGGIVAVLIIAIIAGLARRVSVARKKYLIAKDTLQTSKIHVAKLEDELAVANCELDSNKNQLTTLKQEYDSDKLKFETMSSKYNVVLNQLQSFCDNLK